ncbi:30S ribosomal protein S7 [Patescibacteria group bacterium]
MPRSGRIKKKQILPDPIYASRIVAKLINRVMKDGKKEIASKLVYGSLDKIKVILKIENPLIVLEDALENIKPQMEVRSRRVGGAAYQVPMPVKGERKETLAIRWLIQAARNRSNKEYKTFLDKLAAEIIDAYNNEGGAMKKRENTIKMADANKAFAHFRW